MIFKTLPFEERTKLAQGHKDLLTEERKSEEKFYSSIRCIRCGEKVFPILNNKMPFREGKLIPNTIARCSSCETEFEPHLRIEVTPPKIPIDLI